MRQVVLCFCLLAGLALRAADPAAEDRGFEVKLAVENGHLAALIFGVSPKADTGFDRDFDSPAPPPGHGTGYTAFLLPGTGMFLYRDIKAPAETLVWTFFGRVHANKPIKLEWQAKDLPATYGFRIRGGKDADIEVNMREQQSLTLQQSRQLTLTASLRQPAQDSKEKRKR